MTDETTQKQDALSGHVAEIVQERRHAREDLR